MANGRPRYASRLTGTREDSASDERREMPILQIEHAVRDFDRWKQAFDSDPAGRQQGGVRRYRILRAADDPNFVVIELEFDGADEAAAFQERLHQLWSGGASERLGLDSPQARVMENVEASEY
jgi:hypothetical protein